jgi:hypothetical protein
MVLAAATATRLLAAGPAPEPAREPPAARMFAPTTVSLPGTHESFNGFTRDGLLVFTRCRADYTGCEILEAARRGSTWEVQGRAPFARGGTVSGATVRPGFSVTFHTTPRLPGEGSGGDWKIWEAVLGDWAWTRRRLAAPLNSDARECCAAPAGGREQIYFSSDRAGLWQIFRASGNAGGSWSVEKLPAEVNASRIGQWPSFAGDGGDTLLFSAIRADGPGGDDVYVAFRRNARWTPARALPAPINSPAYDDGARLSPDGKLLFWSSTRPTSAGDRSSNIYTIEVGELLRP